MPPENQGGPKERQSSVALAFIEKVEEPNLVALAHRIISAATLVFLAGLLVTALVVLVLRDTITFWTAAIVFSAASGVGVVVKVALMVKRRLKYLNPDRLRKYQENLEASEKTSTSSRVNPKEGKDP